MNRPIFSLSFLLVAFLLLSTSVQAGMAYHGEWSNGSGETLVISSKTLQYGSDDEISYRDITKASDGTTFHLKITKKGEVNLFSPFLFLVVGDDGSLQMKMFSSYEDLMADENEQGSITWYKE